MEKLYCHSHSELYWNLVVWYLGVLVRLIPWVRASFKSYRQGQYFQYVSTFFTPVNGISRVAKL